MAAPWKASIANAGGLKSGKPWPRLIALCSRANLVKVVKTVSSRDCIRWLLESVNCRGKVTTPTGSEVFGFEGPRLLPGSYRLWLGCHQGPL